MIEVPLRRSLRTRLLLVSLLVEALMLSLLVANSARLIHQFLADQYRVTHEELRVAFNVALAGPMAARDYASLKNILDGWRGAEEIVWLGVTDRNGRMIASSGPVPQPLPPPDPELTDTRPLFCTEFPIEYGGQTFGTLHFARSTAFLGAARERLVTQSLLIAGGEILISFLLLFSIGLWLTRHLKLLAGISAAVAEGDYSRRIDATGSDEVGRLAANFNRMAEAVQGRIADLRESERRFRAIADYTYGWESWFGADGRLNWVNPAVERVTGYSPAECFHLPDFPLPLIYPDDRPLILEQQAQARAEQPGRDLELRVVRKEGQVIWVAMSWQPIFDENGAGLGYRTSIRDITLQHRATEELEFHASHDPLTGLYNRRAFELQLNASLNNGVRPLSLLYIDLDQFKVVNDSCGHPAGDELLQRIARLMNDGLRGGFLARLGGDEFGLLLPGAGQEEAERRGRKLIDEIANVSFSFEGRVFRVGASIGLVTAREGLESLAALMMAADTACYAAKERGRNRLQIYSLEDDLLEQRRREYLSVSDITEALAEARFELYYQTIAAIAPGRRDHAEILVRLRDRGGEMVAPAHFIPAAERYGLMPWVDRFIIEAVCRWLADARAAQLPLPWERLAINLSGTTLNDEQFPAFVRDTFAQYAVEPARICFEVTETAAITNLERTVAFLAELRAQGCRIALDDFGTGLSSFAYLKRIPADYLKIDGLFVKSLEHDLGDRAVVSALVQVARAQGIATVAEYVCSETVLAEVKRLGVDFAQGYAVDRPRPLRGVLDPSARVLRA